jgi:hypothetical protein
MTSLQVVAVSAVAVWLAALSVAVVLVIRQIGLLTIRLTYAAPHGAAESHGPPLGSKIPHTASELLGLNGAPRAVIFLSATCMPCRDFAESIAAEDIDGNITILISGRVELAEGVAALLPAECEPLLDPISSEIANDFGVDMVPFGLLLADGAVRNKTYLKSREELDAMKTPTGQRAKTIAIGSENGG